VNFTTSENLVIKSIMLPHSNGRKYTSTSPDGKIHIQIDHILIDRRSHSILLDVRSFRAAECDTGHYLVVAKIRERLGVNKKGLHMSHMGKFSLKFNKVEGKEKYPVKIYTA
jgi:hypothetical protein